MNNHSDTFCLLRNSQTISQIALLATSVFKKYVQQPVPIFSKSQAQLLT